MELLIMLLLAAILVFLFFLWQRSGRTKDNNQGLVLLQNQLQDFRNSVETKLGEGNQSMLSESRKIAIDIRDTVTKHLLDVERGVSETKASTQQVFTIAEQLKSLERVLKNQKQRGNLGETSLELILSNVLPGQYQSQYQFKNGEKVDVVVKTREGLVPVDAKFPLENYTRLIDELDDVRREEFRKNFKTDVKRRIDETAKYIRPEEGTTPFAIMFIPAESIYYDLLNSGDSGGVNSRDLIDYAFQKKNVLIASPTTFLAYLQTVLFGNTRMKVQEAAQEILRNVQKLDKHFKDYEKYHTNLGKSLTAAMHHYEDSGTAFRLIPKDILRISEQSSGEIPALSGPERDE